MNNDSVHSAFLYNTNTSALVAHARQVTYQLTQTGKVYTLQCRITTNWKWNLRQTFSDMEWTL